MTGVIIATHGTMASAALELCEMLTGTKEKVETIGFCPGDSLEELMERFEKAIAALDGPTLILTDIKGGSPCNVAMVMQKLHENVRVISGFNVPLLLHLFDTREEAEDLEELMDEVIAVGKGAMCAAEAD